jgi:hypothetical protein
MNKYLKKYEDILHQLIKESFPSLKDKKIFLKEKKAPWRAHVVYSLRGMKIEVSYKLRRFDKKVIRRILIHELCHLEIFLKWGFLRTHIDYIIYSISKSHRNKVEKEADILMIKKGYGKLVLDAQRNTIKRGLKYSLTEEEIRYYAKKFKQK